LRCSYAPKARNSNYSTQQPTIQANRQTLGLLPSPSTSGALSLPHLPLPLQQVEFVNWFKIQPANFAATDTPLKQTTDLLERGCRRVVTPIRCRPRLSLRSFRALPRQLVNRRPALGIFTSIAEFELGLIRGREVRTGCGEGARNTHRRTVQLRCGYRQNRPTAPGQRFLARNSADSRRQCENSTALFRKTLSRPPASAS
jgi:hypothetical protein